MRKLQEYSKKRHFDVTSEPRAARGARLRHGLSFVVQKHAASRLHFDFRLELDGTLKSWAVPKGPSLNPADKRLAVQVEDHPLDYATFEGKIPEGQYGGGEVIVWDRGTWEPRDEDSGEALRRGKLYFTLNGERLRGAWHLFRLSGDGEAKQPNWFLVKVKDEFADPDGDRLVRDEQTSIASGKTLEDLAAGKPAGRSGQVAAKAKATVAAPGATRARSSRKARSRSQSLPDFGAATGARPAPMTDYQPQLCTLADAVPEGDDWIHEVKFDGYRLVAHRDSANLRMLSRRELDWANQFKTIVAALKDIPLSRYVIDGEACAVDESGRPSFQLLQASVKQHTATRMIYFVFDLLYADDFDLRKVPLVERRALLREVVNAAPSPSIQFSEHIAGSAEDVKAAACRMGLEGVIAKKASGVHTSRRTLDWLKIKCGKRQEFVVIGWSAPSGSRKGFGSLVLGAYQSGKLICTGRVGTGFNEVMLRDISKKLKTLKAPTSEARDTMTTEEQRGVTWVKPELVAEVSFTEWTDDRRLRHPSFEGLREDKDPRSIIVEEPVHVARKDSSAPKATGQPAPATRARRWRSRRDKEETAEVAGITITHPGRLVYADVGVTKLQVAQYYDMVAPFILPFMIDRPLSTLRCPEGHGSPCFFQKHVRVGLGPWVKPIKVEETEGEGDYLSIGGKEGLISLVQAGVLEFHPWASRAETLEQPEFFVIDLDPGEGVPFEQVVVASLDIKALLERIDFVSFAKVTGGKGVHVVVPMTPSAEWDEVKNFTHAIALHLAKSEPGRFLATMTKSKRTGRIFVDYLRNGRGATAIAPYSTRNRSGAAISMPVSWAELKKLESASAFSVVNAGEYLRARRKDPWAEFFRTRQKITPARAKALIREAARGRLSG